MSCCCSPRSSKMNAPPSTPRPANCCDWCETDLSDQIIYILDTETIEDKSRISYRIGAVCCMNRGKHGDFCNEFSDRWNTLPMMNFMFEARPENVTRLFTSAKELHYKRRSPEVVRDAFRSAWNTYKRLSVEDQALVEH